MIVKKYSGRVVVTLLVSYVALTSFSIILYRFYTVRPFFYLPLPAEVVDIPPLEASACSLSTQLAMLDLNDLDPKTYNEDLTSWSTYRNTQYGFQFKYPTAWQVEVAIPQNEQSFFISIIQHGHTLFYVHGFKGSLEDMVSKESGTLPYFTLNTTKIFVAESGMDISTSLKFEKNGYVYSIEPSFGAFECDTQVFNTIVGTFRFIK
jgi:hypothetical protein